MPTIQPSELEGKNTNCDTFKNGGNFFGLNSKQIYLHIFKTKSMWNEIHTVRERQKKLRKKVKSIFASNRVDGQVISIGMRCHETWSV